MEIDRTNIETKGYEFYWPVAHDGYEIATEAQYTYPIPHPQGADWANYLPIRIFLLNSQPKTETHSPWLMAKIAQDFTPPRVFTPLSNPVVHRKFAQLKTENLETEVLNFAARHGMLGRTANLHSLPSAPAGTLPVRPGESLRLWQREIDKMGVLLAIWDLIRTEDAGKLGQIVVWPDSDAVAVRFKWKSQEGRYSISRWDEEEGNGNSAGDMWAWRGKPRHFFELYQRGDILGPARDYLCEMVNHHLDGITPRLSPHSGYKIAFAPESLIDALWLLFMLELDGKTRVCWQCGNQFEALRKDKIYCTSGCRRMAHHYRKKVRRYQMRGHLKQRSKGSWTIALNLGRDPSTGKRKQQWVTIRGTKKQAETKLVELQHQMDSGGYINPPRKQSGHSCRDIWTITYLPKYDPIL